MKRPASLVVLACPCSHPRAVLPEQDIAGLSTSSVRGMRVWQWSPAVDSYSGFCIATWSLPYGRASQSFLERCADSTLIDYHPGASETGCLLIHRVLFQTMSVWFVFRFWNVVGNRRSFVWEIRRKSDARKTRPACLLRGCFARRPPERSNILDLKRM